MPPVYSALMGKVKIMVYNGDTDMACDYVTNQRCIDSLDAVVSDGDLTSLLSVACEKSRYDTRLMSSPQSPCTRRVAAMEIHRRAWPCLGKWRSTSWWLGGNLPTYKWH